MANRHGWVCFLYPKTDLSPPENNFSQLLKIGAVACYCYSPPLCYLVLYDTLIVGCCLVWYRILIL